MPINCSHDRNYWIPEQRVDDIYRILCVGDSMLFGCGVMQDETLPAHLETILNETAPDLHVETINDAVAGYSLYDEWNRFMLRGHRYKPDLLIIIIDENDAELVTYKTQCNRGKKITYREHVDNSWKEGSICLPHFKAEMENIHRQSMSLNIQVIIAFYRISKLPKARRSASIIEGLCNKYEIGFVDLSTEYWSKMKNDKDKRFWVSEADGHPSSLAHKIAAQKLSNFILENIDTKIATHKQSKCIGNQNTLFEILLKMHNNGYDHEYILYHLHQLLCLKQKSNLSCEYENCEHNENDLQNTLSLLSSISQYNYNLLFWEAYNRILNKNCEKFYDHFAIFDINISRQSKSLFFISNVFINKSIKLVSYFHEVNPADFDLLRLKQTLDQLSFCSQQLYEADGSLLSTMGKLKNVHPLSDFVRILDINMISNIKNIFFYWNQIDLYMKSFISLLNEFIDSYERHHYRNDIVVENEQIWRLFLGIGKSINDVASIMINHVYPLLNLSRVAMPKSNSLKKPVTHLKITIAGKAEEPFVLWAQTKAEIPARRPISDLKYLFCDGKMHTYYFEFPLFFLGKLSFLIEAKNDVFIEEISIYNNPEKAHSPTFPEKVTPQSNHFTINDIFLQP